ncbi:RhoGEF and PH and PH 11 and FYVE domain containin g protein [Trichuris trichiura]|uniref:RhoGEF and PH and PH 11 and FYVE domain containin g protein n=1 Tax=Trichuris trichiura TaxID=36087 RepID=A0A077YZ26_TRITR|nr:RhoGEF and PH and PH 11 and FYVE domain containin g protein [Trichuris trichiura]
MGAAEVLDIFVSSSRMHSSIPPPVPPKPKNLVKYSQSSVGPVRAVRPAPPPPTPSKPVRPVCTDSVPQAESNLTNVMVRSPSAPTEFDHHTNSSKRLSLSNESQTIFSPRRASVSVFNDSTSEVVQNSRRYALPGHESYLSERSSGVYSGSESSDIDEFEIQERSADKLFRVAQEMCNTERAYVETLRALSVDFPNFIRQRALADHRVMTQPDVAFELSRHLDALRKLHQEISEQLQARHNFLRSQKQLITDVLLKVGHFLKMSRMFLQQKGELSSIILNACRQYPEFASALRSFEEDRFNGLLLVHQLDCVHQRICRYPLLLNTYLKYLPKQSDEYPIAIEAKALLENVALEIENGLVEGDNMRKMYQIQRRMQSDYEIIQPGRKLFKEGEIMKHSRKEIHPRFLLLFSDVLLYCAPVVPGSSMLRIRNELPLYTLDDPVLPDNDATSLEFHLRSQRRSIILLCKTTAERDQWVQAIRAAIDHANGRFGYRDVGCDSMVRLPVEASRYSIQLYFFFLSLQSSGETASDPLHEIGRKAPPWVPDDRVTMCQHCSSLFTTIRRRHHCRGCGKVICRRCIGKAPLEYTDLSVEIVCPDCFDVLVARSFAEDDSTPGRYNSVESLKCGNFLPPRSRCVLDQSGCCQRRALSNDQAKLGGSCIKKGYLWLQKKRDWKKHWCLLGRDAVIEFYGASEDKVAKMTVVLLSYEIHKIVGVQGEPDVVKMTHKNQVLTSGSQLLQLLLKANSNEATDGWYEAIRRTLLDFEDR